MEAKAFFQMQEQKYHLILLHNHIEQIHEQFHFHGSGSDNMDIFHKF